MKSFLQRYWWVALIVFLILIQLIPYGRDHTNPPVYQEPQWPSDRVRSLAVRACYDCHSNESTYPWYANIAPISWLVMNDIETGREVLNFSNFAAIKGTGEIAEIVLEGEMPPLIYLITHPSANLSSAERQELADGINQAFGR